MNLWLNNHFKRLQKYNVFAYSYIMLSHSRAILSVFALAATSLASSSAPILEPEQSAVNQDVYMVRNGMTDRVDRNMRDYLASIGSDIKEPLWNPFPATTIDIDDIDAKSKDLITRSNVAYVQTNGFYCPVGNGFMVMGISPVNLQDISQRYGFYEERLAIIFAVHEFGHALTRQSAYSDVTGINPTDESKRSETQSDFYALLAIKHYYGQNASINDSHRLEKFREDSADLAHKNPEAVAWLRENYLDNRNVQLDEFSDIVSYARGAYNHYMRDHYTPVDTPDVSTRKNPSVSVRACTSARQLKLGD